MVNFTSPPGMGGFHLTLCLAKKIFATGWMPVLENSLGVFLFWAKLPVVIRTAASIPEMVDFMSPWLRDGSGRF